MIWEEVLKFINLSQNNLYKKYRFKNLEQGIQIWKSLTFPVFLLSPFPPPPYHSHIHWLDFIVNFEKKKKKKERSTHLQAFFICLLAQADSFFLCSLVYQKSIKIFWRKGARTLSLDFSALQYLNSFFCFCLFLCLLFPLFIAFLISWR